MTESSNPSKSEKRGNCCISHKFVDAASINPDKIAVIHASGWATRIESDLESPEPCDFPSCTPPVYDGDKCFTFAELSSSIDSLSSRLRRILDAPSHNDPYLIRRRFQEKLDSETDSDVYMPKVLALYMPPSVEYIHNLCAICFEVWRSLFTFRSIMAKRKSVGYYLLFKCYSGYCLWLFFRSIRVCPVLFFSMSAEIGRSSFVWPCKIERQRKF